MHRSNEYKELDAALLAAIRAGVSAFSALLADPPVHAETSRMALWHGGDAFRYADRRLQALRKAGAIQYARSTGWVTAGKADTKNNQ